MHQGAGLWGRPRTQPATTPEVYFCAWWSTLPQAQPSYVPAWGACPNPLGDEMNPWDGKLLLCHLSCSVLCLALPRARGRHPSFPGVSTGQCTTDRATQEKHRLALFVFL